MVAVAYREPHLIVAFADGSEVAVDVARFSNPHWIAQRPDWPRVRLDPDHIVVPTANEDEGIPWTAIRRLTDPEFAAYWEERATEAALQTGRRLRELREERGLTVSEVALRAGVTPETVAEVEAGRRGGDLALHDRLLAALGLDFRSLIAPDDDADGA
jgi:DNA-binding XRE family transcriptional regulator